MKRKIAILCSVFLVFGTISVANAHLPPGELFFAAQFPDNLVPTIDGEHSDWDILPESPYSIFNDRLFDPAQFQQAARGEIDIDWDILPESPYSIRCQYPASVWLE